MIKYAVIIVGLTFAVPIACSDFTLNSFSTTKFSTGFFIGLTPFLLAQTLKKSLTHQSIHFYPIIAAGSVVSAVIFEGIGSMSRMKNSNDKEKKRLGESFIGGFLSGFFGGPLSLWLANTLG
jgi:hypothetical protein